ncbi:transposable element Tcb1 transposase [Trichonephila clavipes]|uniref:Transposable element Tcb1 transposase n=1 Tax=Trichonephila clavipes TaxID=2585209 RepID=A0A8X7BB00_TRICX|nr:transposable element Tcb1 transposase [Trichonephila clavipes]
MFTDESRFALETDDKRIRIWQSNREVSKYQDEVLEPIVRWYAAAVGPTFVLMDDKAHPHRADIVDDYLESEGIARKARPAYSPDLNPIENLWDSLGCAVSSRFLPSATLIVLEIALQEKRLLNSAVVDHLIESIVRRYSDKDIRLNKRDFEESEESADVIDNIPVNPDVYVAEWILHNFLADLRLELFCGNAVVQQASRNLMSTSVFYHINDHNI